MVSRVKLVDNTPMDDDKWRFGACGCVFNVSTAEWEQCHKHATVDDLLDAIGDVLEAYESTLDSQDSGGTAGVVSSATMLPLRAAYAKAKGGAR